MKRLLASAFVFTLPAVAFGQSSGQIGFLFRQILEFFANTIAFLGPVLISLALLAFFFSLVRFLYNKDDTEKSKGYLLYSVLILFVMVSIWGIVRFIQQNLGIRDGLDQTNIPRVPIGQFGSGRYGDSE
jgi:hypothetical protein